MLDIFIIIVMGLSFLGMAVCVTALVRNNLVYNFRSELGRIVSDMSHRDIVAGKDFQWRYEILRKVDYDTMMRKFWKPLKPEAFWDDLSFLEEPKDE